MNDLDTRLRDAMAARTTTIPHPAEPDWDSHARRRTWPVLVTAGLVLAVVAVGLLIRPGQRPDSTFAPATPVLPVRPAAAPTLLLDIGRTTLKVEEVATGRVLASARLPAGYTQYAATQGNAAFAADNRTFFAAVVATGSGRVAIAEYRLDEQGRLGPPRLVVQAPADRDFGGLAVSPDATRLALTADKAYPISPGNASKAPAPDRPSQLAVWNLATGSSRTFTAPAQVTSIAWAADSRHLHWTTNRGSGTLDPSASGSALHATRPALQGVLLPNGDAVDQPDFNGQIVLRPATGGPARVLDTWTDRFGMMEAPRVDNSGTYVLYVRNGVRVRLDLRTHQRTTIGVKAGKFSEDLYVW